MTAKMKVTQTIKNNPGIDFIGIWNRVKYNGYKMSEIVEVMKSIETNDNFIIIPTYTVHEVTVPTTYIAS